jgi:protein-tyrosine phosphatase
LGNLPLGELCIEGTDYLLLELPYAVFSTNFINSFKNYLSFCDVNVVLAHIERYYDYNMPERVEEILSLGLLSQANCDSVVSVRSRRRTLELIRSGKIGLLGTDLHSLDERPPRFAEAEKIIRKKLSDSAFEQMMATAAEILNR